MITGANGAAGASGTGPSAGYTLILFLVTVLTSSSLFVTTVITYMLPFLQIKWIKFNLKMPNFLTIQKPDRHFPVRGFASALKSDNFDGTFYKRWHARMILWLTAMNCYHTAQGKPEQLTSEQDSAFEVADNLFRGGVISALADKYVDSYITCKTAKELWDALDVKFGVSDAGSELYLIEQLFDYKMVEDRSVVEQAHEIQSLAKELEQFPCVLPDKFVAGGIISKLPPSWKDFATSLKHKRQEFSVADLIGTLDVEERARAKDIRGKGVDSSTANMMQKKNNSNASHNKKKKQEKKEKPKQTATFKKKKGKEKNEGCFVCGSSEHWASSCPDRKFIQPKKSANMVISEPAGTSGYGNLLPTVLSVCHSPEWWMDIGANVHVCADVSLFSSYQAGVTRALLMGNGSHARVLGVGTVTLNLISGKTMLLKNVQHVPSIKKNLVSGSLLCRDGFKIVLESNKCVLSKYGTFVGKGYDCGGLFRFSLHDNVCNNVVNNVLISDESNIWHSRLCHVNFGCMSRLANLNLIPKFNLVKGSKCHACVCNLSNLVSLTRLQRQGPWRH